MQYDHYVLEAPSVQVRSERRFRADVRKAEWQRQVESVTGIPPGAQQVDGHPEFERASADAPILHVCGIQPGDCVRVLDRRGVVLDAAAADAVEKFEMSDADYAARTDTVRAFKQAHGLGRFGAASASASASTSSTSPAPRLDPSLQVGHRCMVQTSERERRGTIAFIGPTAFAPGVWVGVAYDEPVGKNDGSVQGTRYFSTRMYYGGFVRPAAVHTGAAYAHAALDDELANESEPELEL